MNDYLDVLEDIMENGIDRPNRTGIDTRALFGKTLHHDMRDGFPAVTTKKLAFDVMRAENIWFLTGSRDEKYLERLGAKIWKKNAEADYWKDRAKFQGDVGRIYSIQMRHRSISLSQFLKRIRDIKFSEKIKSELHHQEESYVKIAEKLAGTGENGTFKILLSLISSFITTLIKERRFGLEIDQLKNVLDSLEEKPYSRRHIIDLWNPSELDQMCLPPCHLLYQFHVDDEGGLHLTMYQRSCDMFLGVPFNKAHCALWLSMFAQALGYEPRTITILLADAHIYHNHFEQVEEQLSREAKDLPDLWLSPKIDKDFLIDLKGNETLTKSDLDELIRLEKYDHHPHIPAPMAV